VITTRPWRQRGELVDFPGAVLATGAAAGLIPVERCVALLAGLRDGTLVPRPSFFQLRNLRQARARGKPWHLIAHEDILIFRAPGFSGSLRQLKAPPREAGSPAQPPCDVDAEDAGGLGAAALCADLDSTREAPSCSEPGQRQRGRAA
jgi:modification methylase